MGARRIRSRVAAGALVLGLMSGLFAAGPYAQGTNNPPILRNASGQFILMRYLLPAPSEKFHDDSGGALDIDAFRGQIVLLNFWATWCAPCLREMPSLDRLQAALGGADFTVVAVSTDRTGSAAVRPYFRRLRIANLSIYLDPERKLGDAFGLRDFPITYVIDRQGKVRGAIAGEVDWDRPDARALIRYYINDKRE